MRMILTISAIVLWGSIACPYFANGSDRESATYKNGNVRLSTNSAAVSDNMCSQQTGHTKLVCLADALKATVSPSLKARLEIPYAIADAKRWSNLPPAFYPYRVGPTLSDFSPPQLGLINAILREALGSHHNEGYDELEQILNASDFTKANAPNDQGFASGNFHIAFIGTPAAKGVWQLYFGGHHLAVSNTYRDGRLIGGTPSFRAIEPFADFIWNGRTNAPLTQERDTLADMLLALKPAEQRRARMQAVFPDLLARAQNDENFPASHAGVRVGDLTSQQKALVVAAIKTYVMDLADPDATEIMRKYVTELDDTYIAFSGTPTLKARNDYVRIDGPSVWIEFSMQPGQSFPNAHPHSIWRDRKADYGGK